MTSSYREGILMALVAVFCWSGSGSFAKLIDAGGVSQLTVVCYRGLFVAAAAGLYLFWKNGWSAFHCSRRALAACALLGVFVVVFNAVGYMMACTYLTVPQVLMISYIFPIVTMAGSAFINRERPTLLQFISAFLILAGLYVGFMTDKSAGPVSFAGVAWVLLSVTGLAGQSLLSRKLSQLNELGPLTQLFFAHLIGGLVIAAAKTFTTGWGDLAFVTPKIFLFMQYPAAVTALIGYGLLFAALSRIPAPLTSIICSMEIVFALILTPLYIHQVPSSSEIAGSMIIITAVVMSIASSNRKVRSAA